MLGTLAKYIFGGMISDAPETTAPEMQYHTREVNDWLLVDMPDQAIDDEDMDSESDDDEILTALPLLMAEEVTLQIVQSCEDIKDYSACDNSSRKIQKHIDDKIRSVSSGVQHNSGDKNQGNFVDKIEAISVEDNFHAKIQDISVPTQDMFSSAPIQDKSDTQICDISVQANSINEVQHAYVMVQENSNLKNQCIFPSQTQGSSDDDTNGIPNAKFEDVSAEKNSTGEIQDSSADKIHDNSIGFNRDNINEIETVFNNTVQDDVNDEIQFVSSEVQNNSNDKIMSKFVDKVDAITEIEECFFSNICDNLNESQDKKYRFQAASDVEPRKLNRYVNDDEVHKNSDSILSRGQGKFYQQCNNENQINSNSTIQDNFSSSRKLYSHVVRGCHDRIQVDTKNSDSQIINNFVDKVEAVLVEVEDDFLSNIRDIFTEDTTKIQVAFNGTEVHKLYNPYITNKEAEKDSNTAQEIFNRGQKRFYQEDNTGSKINSNDSSQDNFTRSRKLYSHVVRDNNTRIEESFDKPRQDVFGVELGKCDRYVRIFGRDLESSDDEIQEMSDDETDENSNDEMQENSDAEIEDNFGAENNLNGGSRDKSYVVSRLSFDEEKEDYSDYISSFQREINYVFSRETPENKILDDVDAINMLLESFASNNEVGRIPYASETKYKRPNASDCTITVPSWHRYPKGCSLDIAYQYEIQEALASTDFCPHYEMFQIQEECRSVIEEDELIEEKPSTPTPCLVSNSAEIFLNLINQKSTAQPTKTAVAYVKEQIKELKPMQLAIQFENRKYMTRSQLNRQNRNYIYQSSVKTNRRRNLQRNHSGANNNRKC